MRIWDSDIGKLCWNSMFFMSIEKRINYLKRDIMAYMSQEGYDKLVADLQYLESVERPKASC